MTNNAKRDTKPGVHLIDDGLQDGAETGPAKPYKGMPVWR